MKYSSLFLTSLVLLVGCASPFEREEQYEGGAQRRVAAVVPYQHVNPNIASTQIDQTCADIAKTVKAVAIIRDKAVPLSNVQFLLSGANGWERDFPLDPIVKDVYSNHAIDPSAAADQSYSNCVAMGSYQMIARLREAQRAQRSK